MEIKVQCGCGTKFAFEVEPKEGRMPCGVSCPNCGADATEAANQVIQQQSGTSGLRLRVAEPGPSSPPPAAPSPPEPPVRPPAASRKAPAKVPRGKASKFAFLWKVALPLLVLGFILFSVGRKWVNRARTVVEVMSSEALDETEVFENNFSFEDAVFLYVRHEDRAAVARASLESLSRTLQRRGAISNVVEDLQEDFGQNDWYLFPAHNGYVSMYSGLSCTRPVYDGLARSLSKELATTVMIYRDVDFTGEFYFTVYQAGERMMEAEMKLVGNTLMDAEETTTFTGEDWATQHGYVEDSKDDEFYERFHWGHAEAISKDLGLKLWDQEYNPNAQLLWLRML
jgi:hypothetical protein